MKWRKQHKTEASPRKLLLWTALAGLIFGFIGFGELAEDVLRAGRNSLHRHSASGDIVFVAIDAKSLQHVGRWPWPRRNYAELVDKLTAQGAKSIFLDIVVDTQNRPEDDRAFIKALKNSGRVTLAVLARSGPGSGAQPDSTPRPEFMRYAEVGNVSLSYNYQNAVWRLPYTTRWKGRDLPSAAAILADVSKADSRSFMVDYSLDPKTVPVVPAKDVLTGTSDPRTINGKRVVIGAATELIGDQYFIPGTGKMGGAYIQILGAETLKHGIPRELGWIPGLLVALAAAGLALTRNTASSQRITLSGAAVGLLLGSLLLEMRQIYADIVPGLFVTIVIALILTRRRWKQRGLVSSVSGLPNLSALRTNPAGRDQALIAARVLNYSEIAATLPPAQERQLVEQIVSRLRVGSADRILYEGDGGIFAWFEESRLPFGHHLEALYALFRNAAKVDGQSIDLSISFGVEIGSSRSLANRLGSALVAADEAAHDGLKWKYHDPESLETASWRLSMLSQLDDAVDKGEVWVAYQPKLDLKSQRIVGAEALARWTHPEKGPIAASEFIGAAEQNDRIGKLTDFVLDQAIGAAAMLNGTHSNVGMAVNLSARLLSDKGFTLRLSAMLARHQLPARLLTLELTETAELASSGAAMDMLAALRDLGITISIDDYGTGLSTLDYLKKIPASEIKIDQSFVKSMLDNRSDRLMVQSTISLAHELGRRVVAEGVERREILDALIEMNCDVAQGYIIGRPMSLEALAKRISGSGSIRATG